MECTNKLGTHAARMQQPAGEEVIPPCSCAARFILAHTLHRSGSFRRGRCEPRHPCKPANGRAAGCASVHKPAAAAGQAGGEKVANRACKLAMHGDAGMVYSSQQRYVLLAGRDMHHALGPGACSGSSSGSKQTSTGPQCLAQPPCPGPCASEYNSQHFDARRAGRVALLVAVSCSWRAARRIAPRRLLHCRGTCKSGGSGGGGAQAQPGAL